MIWRVKGMQREEIVFSFAFSASPVIYAIFSVFAKACHIEGINVEGMRNLIHNKKSCVYQRLMTQRVFTAGFTSYNSIDRQVFHFVKT